MCVFCAAIPAAAALGAAAHGKQNEARRRAADSPHEDIAAPESGEIKGTARPLPIAAITGVVIAGLMVGSIVTHVSGSSS